MAIPDSLLNSFFAKHLRDSMPSPLESDFAEFESSTGLIVPPIANELFLWRNGGYFYVPAAIELSCLDESIGPLSFKPIGNQDIVDVALLDLATQLQGTIGESYFPICEVLNFRMICIDEKGNSFMFKLTDEEPNGLIRNLEIGLYDLLQLVHPSKESLFIDSISDGSEPLDSLYYSIEILETDVLREYLLRGDANVSFGGWPILKFSAHTGNLDAVKMLVQANAAVNFDASTKGRPTLFQDACASRRFDLISMLWDLDAHDIEGVDKEVLTASWCRRSHKFLRKLTGISQTPD